VCSLSAILPTAKTENYIKEKAGERSLFDAQPNGFINSEGVLKRQKDIFRRVNHAVTDAVFLTADGHASHTNLTVNHFATSYHVHVPSSPQDNTQIFNPLPPPKHQLSQARPSHSSRATCCQ
jgi:hypothetical protein